MVRDPVCGMEMRADDAAAATEYDGQTYYFCCEQCRQQFLADPERYAVSQVA